MRNLKQIYERYVDNDNADTSWELEFYADVQALLKVEVVKAKIEVLTNFKSDYADDLSVEAYEELVEIISKLQAEVESNDN